MCTTGGAPPDVLGPLPDNVRAAAYLPHDHLLPLVDLVVTNGGWGGVLAAARVVWSGVGLDLHTDTPRPARVRAAVERALADRRTRERARALGAALAAAGGAARACDLLEALLTDRPAVTG